MARPRLYEDAATTQTAFKLSETDLVALRYLAALANQSPSEWIRTAVRERIEREKNGAV